MNSGDEAEAISRSRQGDVQAFNHLVEHYQSRVYALCFRMLGDDDGTLASRMRWSAAGKRVPHATGRSRVAQPGMEGNARSVLRRRDRVVALLGISLG